MIMGKYHQDPRIVGYVRTKELDKKLDDGSSFFNVGLDAPRCWGDEPPYDFLEPLYRAAPLAGVPVFRIKHGPRGSDGAPESYSFESLTDAGVENFPHGTMLYTDPDQEIARLRAALEKISKIEDSPFAGYWDEINEARSVAKEALGVK